MKSRLEQLLDELLRQIDIPAMEQAMSKQYKSQIRRRWELPADYWMLLERCCGLRTVWSNDTYEALELWGLDTLVKGQEGYAYNPVEQKVIKDWDEHLVVIASDAGDPYCLDLRRNDTAVFWAHRSGPLPMRLCLWITRRYGFSLPLIVWKIFSKAFWMYPKRRNMKQHIPITTSA